MKILNNLIIGVLALLSVAAGLAKVMQTEQEMQFLQSFGLSSTLIIAFGVVQIAGGALLLFRKTRLFGAILVVAALAISTALIFVGGNLVFGLLSIIPIALAGVIIYQSVKTANSKP